jgi:protein YIPF5/7
LIYCLINLLTKRGVYVELYSTLSVLGYSLLPFIFLAFSSLFFDLTNPVGVSFTMLVVLWSTVTATRFFENGLDIKDQRYLIGYPILLFYGIFLLLAVF